MDTPSEFARFLLGDLDKAVASLDAILLGGQPQTFEEYRRVVDRRLGLLQARQLVVDRLDVAARHALGIKPTPPARPRGSPLGGPLPNA